MHLGDAIPSTAILLSEGGTKTAPATPGRTKTNPKEEYVARLSDFVRFIMDTGCGFDLIDAATARLFPNAIRNVKPVDLHTANGTTTFNKALKFHVGPLSEDATAFVLPDTPWVLSARVEM